MIDLAAASGVTVHRGQMTLDTNDFDVQVRCVLLQQPDIATKLIWYWSRSLASAERIYDVTQREWLAIVWAKLLFRPYLEGTRFIIKTDHDSLE